MLINAYMDIKRKHINFLFKYVNTSAKDYNFKRPYFFERCTNSKLLNRGGVMLKNNRGSLTTNIHSAQFETLEIKRNDCQHTGEKIIHTINSYLKRDTCKAPHQIDITNYTHDGVVHNNIIKGRMKSQRFTSQATITREQVITNRNSNNIINMRFKNRYFQIEVRKDMHTMRKKTNEKKCKRNGNPSESTSEAIIENVNQTTEHTCQDENSAIPNVGKTHFEGNQIHIRNMENIHYSVKNGGPPKGIFSIYSKKMSKVFNNLFEKHLLLMNCVIAGTLYFIADIACQMMEAHSNNNEYDILRTLRMSTIGLTLEGPLMTWWYGKILANFIKSKPNTFLYKSFIPTMFDNFIFGPIHLTIFFFYNGMLKNQRKSEIIDKIANTGMKVFFISLMTWTPLTLINFVFVPRIYQATVVFFADFFWVIFLSWCANRS
ncbi:hypothetical protein, conserved [Plasmodium gonderi]|uniref:Protein Mpv17 n=1 Tax=Plasmodium gonderi TaxID=77519 RepID=A0A1Y1JMD4_PLAGO|nr:hypothetical protein, conserved [Plasmodium gonderi]GAW81543.1 hypothetical protein, conserved [Plasmodium gonderi]